MFLNFLSFLIHPENFNNYLNVILYSTSKEYYANLGSGIGLIGLADGLVELTSFENNKLLVVQKWEKGRALTTPHGRTIAE